MVEQRRFRIVVDGSPVLLCFLRIRGHDAARVVTRGGGHREHFPGGRPERDDSTGVSAAGHGVIGDALRLRVDGELDIGALGFLAREGVGKPFGEQRVVGAVEDVVLAGLDARCPVAVREVPFDGPERVGVADVFAVVYVIGALDGVCQDLSPGADLSALARLHIVVLATVKRVLGQVVGLESLDPGEVGHHGNNEEEAEDGDCADGPVHCCASFRLVPACWSVLRFGVAADPLTLAGCRAELEMRRIMASSM